MVHKYSLAHPRDCLAYQEYREERSRPIDCRVVQEHRKERESRELALDITALCLGEYSDRLPRGEAPRTQHMRHAHPTCHTISDAWNLSTELSCKPRWATSLDSCEGTSGALPFSPVGSDNRYCVDLDATRRCVPTRSTISGLRAKAKA